MPTSIVRKIIYLLIIVVTFLVVKNPLYIKIGTSLQTEMPLTASDVIIVLSGDSGNRVKMATALYKQGLSQKIIMSGEPLMNTSMPQLMSEYAQSLGVPTKDIIIDDQSTSTYEHPVNCAPILKKLKAKSIIIVTSKYHTRRALSVFKAYYKNTPITIKIAGAEDDILYTKWWKYENMREKILMECAKTIWYILMH